MLTIKYYWHYYHYAKKRWHDDPHLPHDFASWAWLKCQKKTRADNWLWVDYLRHMFGETRRGQQRQFVQLKEFSYDFLDPIEFNETLAEYAKKGMTIENPRHRGWKYKLGYKRKSRGF